MDSHKNHKAFVQMAKRLERKSGHNECCSAPSSCSIPAWDLCERHTFEKHKTRMVFQCFLYSIQIFSSLPNISNINKKGTLGAVAALHSHHHTVVRNCKNPPKIKLKNSWNWLIILINVYNNLTNFEYQVNKMTVNSNYVKMLKFAWKNSGNNFRWIYFWRVLAISNHSPPGPPQSGLVIHGLA